MDLRQLEYFVAVAEELSFTRAAARCRVAQSALSHQVARLERAHGVVLFERTSRTVRLAPAGEVLLPRARGGRPAAAGPAPSRSRSRAPRPPCSSSDPTTRG